MTALEPAPKSSLLQTLDRALRGDFVRGADVAAGRIEVPTKRLVQLAVLLGVAYGLCVGAFGVFQGTSGAGAQIVAAAIKVPLLFLLTLMVTFPSLYVFAALQRLPLDIADTLRLLLLAMLVHLAVMASLGPVFAFFAASTGSYPFMKLLNVLIFVVGGVLGFVVLRTATRHPNEQQARSHAAADRPAAASDPDEPSAAATVLAPSRAAASPSPHQRTSRLLRVWCIVYAIVGAQMGWLLRPFLGSPELPFALLRPRDSNVFADVLQTIGQLFGG